MKNIEFFLTNKDKNQIHNKYTACQNEDEISNSGSDTFKSARYAYEIKINKGGFQ